MTRQSGNAIDEFVTEALRNNLVGLPLDLARRSTWRAAAKPACPASTKRVVSSMR